MCVVCFRSDESSIHNDRNRCQAGVEAENHTAQELSTHAGSSVMLASVIFIHIMLHQMLLTDPISRHFH